MTRPGYIKTAHYIQLQKMSAPDVSQKFMQLLIKWKNLAIKDNIFWKVFILL